MSLEETAETVRDRLLDGVQEILDDSNELAGEFSTCDASETEFSRQCYTRAIEALNRAREYLGDAIAHLEDVEPPDEPEEDEPEEEEEGE